MIATQRGVAFAARFAQRRFTNDSPSQSWDKPSPDADQTLPSPRNDSDDDLQFADDRQCSDDHLTPDRQQSGPPPDAPKGSCYHFWQWGRCKYGDDCRYKHCSPSDTQSVSGDDVGRYHDF